MFSYVMRKIGLALLLMLFVSFVAFVLLFSTGDPAAAIAGESSSAADAERVRQMLGLDDPLPLQYLRWLGQLLQGDLGYSFYFKQPVSALLAERFMVTISVGATGLAFAIALAVPLGILAGCNPNSMIDRLALLVAVVGQAMPSFWFALMLIILLSVTFPILPASGLTSWRHYILPTIVLGYFAAPAIMRLTRSGMIAALETDYIRTARAMGISRGRVIWVHALRNAALPVVSLASAQFGFMLAGSVVVENVFAIHGAGRLAWESIGRSDLPTVLALVLCFSAFYVLLTLVADILNALLDPRIRNR